MEKCPHNEIDGSPGGAPQARNASEDTETRGDGLMKSGGRSVAGSNHAPVEIRRPLSARPQLVRAKELGHRTESSALQRDASPLFHVRVRFRSSKLENGLSSKPV